MLVINYKGENLFYRARRINEKNSKEIVYDLTFSLPKSRASECKLILKHNGTPKLNINDLSNIPNVKTDIKEALADTTGAGSGKLHIKSETPDFYLYRFYGYLEADADDSIDVILIDTAGLVMDTLKSPVGISEDIGHMNIISTIYALTAMSSGTVDPLNPDSIATLPDSAKLKLLITAMVDLSLAHNSPQPDENEQSQGIFTNYMQFMDNVVGKWSTIGSVVNGILRLRNIHDAILEHNREEIIDPVEVINRGTCLDGTKNAKRQNYAFYEGYTRLDAEVSYLPSVSATSTGAGVMFRVSDNIEVYEADIADTFNTFKEPFIPCTTGSRRIIIKANDSLLGKLNSDGIWVKGVGDGEDQQFYIGISKVRLPLKAVAGAKPIGVAFALGKEGAGRGDPAGTIVGGAESNFFKMYTLIENPDGSVDTIINSSNPEVLLHHQKRIIEIDSNYIGKDASFKFDVIGTDTLNKKIFIESSNSYRAVIKDTSQEVGKTLVKVYVKERLYYVGERWILVSKLFAVDAMNGNLRKSGIVGKPVEIKMAIMEGNLKFDLFPELDAHGKVEIRVPNKVDIYSSDYFDPVSTWGYFERKKNGQKVMVTDWKTYKGLIKVPSLYFVPRAAGTHNVEITLFWLPSVMKKVVKEVNKDPLNCHITENITIEAFNDRIILEPITNEIVKGTTNEIYNPSFVILSNSPEHCASFKMDAEGTHYIPEMVKWKSKQGRVEFVDNANNTLSEGSGYIGKVKGKVGEDTLEISIAGYDGIKPIISFYVDSLRTVNVYTTIVTNEEYESAFTDSEIDSSLITANQILKQIGVKLNRVKCSSIRSNEYYRIPNETVLRNLVDENRSTNGLEVYYVRGHNDTTPDMSEMVAINIEGRGIVITKFGNLDKNETESMYSANVLAHEILHSARWKGHSSSSKTVYDIYPMPNEENQTISKDDIINDWGSGYYRKGTMLNDIIKRLLQYGYTTNETKGYDIPFGPIKGTGIIDSTRRVNCGLYNSVYKKLNTDRIFTHDN